MGKQFELLFVLKQYYGFVFQDNSFVSWYFLRTGYSKFEFLLVESKQFFEEMKHVAYPQSR